MYTHTDKTQENKSKSIVDTVSHKQSESESMFQFVDNRPEAVVQRKLKEIANNKSKTTQLKTVTYNHVVQRVEAEDYSGAEREKFKFLLDTIMSHRHGITQTDVQNLLKQASRKQVDQILFWPNAYIQQLDWTSSLYNILRDPIKFCPPGEELPETVEDDEAIRLMTQRLHLDPAEVQNILSVLGSHPDQFGHLLNHYKTSHRKQIEKLNLVTKDQAKGLHITGQDILSSFSPTNYTYVGIGRSPVLLMEYLRQKHSSARVTELPLGKIRHLSDKEKDNPTDPEIQAFVRRIIGTVTHPNVLVIDYAASGASLEYIKKVLEICYPGKRVVKYSLEPRELRENLRIEALPDHQVQLGEKYGARMYSEIGKQAFSPHKSIDVKNINSTTQVEEVPAAKKRRENMVREIIKRFGK